MFTYSIFWKNPVSSLCFFSLAMSFVSLWFRKTLLLWGSFFLIALILGFEAKIVTWQALIPIGLLFVCHFFLQKQLSKATQLLLFGSAMILSLGLGFHFFPGFHNWQIITNTSLSADSNSYNLWLNFDKPLIGLFPLALSIPLLLTSAEWKKMLKITWIMGIVGIAILMGFSFYFNLVRWDPKIPPFFFVWVFANLFFVSLPEEAFFRGFIQRWLYNWFGGHPFAAVGSIFVTSLFFTLMHLIWVADVAFLSLVFGASCIFGTIYAITRSIEASVLCHFGLNLTHILFFSYPFLKS